LHFTVGHGPQHNRSLVNGTGPDGGATSTSFVMADLFGGETLLPDGTKSSNGMTFSGTTSTGATFSGVLKNKVGVGYSKQDGFGFINAETAVRARIHSATFEVEHGTAGHVNGLPFLFPDIPSLFSNDARRGI